MKNDPIRSRRLKQQLPYPYNQDLSKVLRGLKRRNPITRRSRQANDPVTADPRRRSPGRYLLRESSSGT